jgi:hypothetical protein
VLKFGFALTASVLALALPVAYTTRSKLSPRASERALLRQMNSTADGRITRRVDCARLPGTRWSLMCRLTSVRSTYLRVEVDRAGGGYDATWYPLDG